MNDSGLTEALPNKTEAAVTRSGSAERGAAGEVGASPSEPAPVLTQAEVLLAAISQDVNELGLVGSPFQFPCLVEILRGKKWDTLKRDFLGGLLAEPQRLLPSPLTGQ